ncbi:hypothetical protein [Alkalibacillus haloalkaliphilus]|uniref:Uncharacterized protein n=1 Tax=Alkalibacillus haloalkaliphilus TaxID=94136 RepID=A0A511W543_9BACI|nr:hypothetical protein [Alkalibacillus haloalkaliphilus]GEN44482.1 hypothetical protein AHA02nite_02580 [Alkalibacillus haloalkaliphilus]
MFIINEIVIIVVLLGFAVLVAYVLKDVIKSEKKGYSYFLIVLVILIFVMIGVVLMELV